MANTPFTTKIPAFTPADFTLTADMTSATWNATGNHQVASISGLARVIMLVTCVTALTAASPRTINLMWESGANSGALGYHPSGWATSDQITLANHIVSAGRNVISGSDILKQAYIGKGQADAFLDVCVNTADIIYSLGGALTGGSLKFNFWFYPLEASTTFTIGNGS